MSFKYITSSFSNNMWQESANVLLQEELNENQFRKEIIDGFSCVSAEDIAELLNVAVNKQTVKARHGDIVYNVTKEQGEYRFYKIRVMPSTRLDGIYCEELLWEVVFYG